MSETYRDGVEIRLDVTATILLVVFLLWFFCFPSMLTLTYFSAYSDPAVDNRLTVNYHKKLLDAGVTAIRHKSAFHVWSAPGGFKAEVYGSFVLSDVVYFGKDDNPHGVRYQWDNGFNEEAFVEVTPDGIKYRGHLGDDACMKQPVQDCYYQGAVMIIEEALSSIEAYNKASKEWVRFNDEAMMTAQ